MSSEATFIAALRSMATAPGARGLMDDAAVLEIGDERLVLTMDTLVEQVHFLSGDPPASIAWKLVATNVSDLAAKGATPAGCLVSYSLSGRDEWDAAFAKGLGEACARFAIPLLGGDTVRAPEGAPRTFSLTALGTAERDAPIPARRGARAGDGLWVSGCVGDAGIGLRMLLGELASSPVLVERYRRPLPDVALGKALAPMVSAMMDISDGLLIDTSRMAEASGVAIAIAVDQVPMSRERVEAVGDSLDQRLAAVSAGDDYILLFTAAPAAEPMLRQLDSRLVRIGSVSEGKGITLTCDGQSIPLPGRLGYEHGQ